MKAFKAFINFLRHPRNSLSVFDHFVGLGLELKGLKSSAQFDSWIETADSIGWMFNGESPDANFFSCILPCWNKRPELFIFRSLQFGSLGYRMQMLESIIVPYLTGKRNWKRLHYQILIKQKTFVSTGKDREDCDITPFYTPWKYQKTRGFLMFSGGIIMGHWS